MLGAKTKMSGEAKSALEAAQAAMEQAQADAEAYKAAYGPKK
jgi:hypothetical protein